MFRGILLCLPFLIFTINSYSQEYVITKRSSNYLREGAGSYYKQVTVVPEGVKLKVNEVKDKWLNVTTSNKIKGWISKNCITTSEKKHYSESITKSWSSADASKIGLAAAIKGLKGKALKTNSGDVDELIRLLSIDLDEMEVKDFMKTLNREQGSFGTPLEISRFFTINSEFAPSFQEQSVGLGVAARLVGEGVYKNDYVQKYVNLIATTIMSNSPYYDWDFRVFVLNDPEPNGYSCPGGIIFLTKGAVDYCATESELAAIIAHEISHSIRMHGLKEMEKRKVHIQADDEFAEMERDMEDEFSEEEDDLETLIVESYETIFNKRLLEYEYEADQLSSVMCYNAGYDLVAMKKYLTKLEYNSRGKYDLADKEYRDNANLVQRSKNLTKFLKKLSLQEKNTMNTKKRFREIKKLLAEK